MCRKFQFSERTFYNHHKKAVIQHTIKQEAIKKELAEIDKQAAIEARKKAIMTADERKEYLTKIIQGKIKVPYTEIKYNSGMQAFETFELVELASHTARINAIAELNKMEGDYAPTKMEHTGPGGSDLFKMTKEQLLERRKQLSKVLDKRT